MTVKFGTLNPMNGQYTFTPTLDEAVAISARIASDFYLAQTHNQPVVKVEVDDSGVETWSALDGTSLLSPAQIEAQAAELAKHMEAFFDAQQMPVTNL